MKTYLGQHLIVSAVFTVGAAFEALWFLIKGMTL